MTEKEVAALLGKSHISEVKSQVYVHNLRHLINASDVVHVIQLLYAMGFKIEKNDK